MEEKLAGNLGDRAQDLRSGGNWVKTPACQTNCQFSLIKCAENRKLWRDLFVEGKALINRYKTKHMLINSAFFFFCILGKKNCKSPSKQKLKDCQNTSPESKNSRRT